MPFSSSSSSSFTVCGDLDDYVGGSERKRRGFCLIGQNVVHQSFAVAVVVPMAKGDFAVSASVVQFAVLALVLTAPVLLT